VASRPLLIGGLGFSNLSTILLLLFVGPPGASAARVRLSD